MIWLAAVAGGVVTLILAYVALALWALFTGGQS